MPRDYQALLCLRLMCEPQTVKCTSNLMREGFIQEMYGLFIASEAGLDFPPEWRHGVLIKNLQQIFVNECMSSERLCAGRSDGTGTLPVAKWDHRSVHGLHFTQGDWCDIVFPFLYCLSYDSRIEAWLLESLWHHSWAGGRNSVNDGHEACTSFLRIEFQTLFKNNRFLIWHWALHHHWHFSCHEGFCSFAQSRQFCNRSMNDNFATC